MTLKKISPEALNEKMQNQEKVILLDVRAEEKYNQYHIEDLALENINIPKTNIFEGKEEVISKLPKDKEIIVTCTTGNSATKCANILAEKDYNVIVLEGGVTAWKEYCQNKE